MVYCMNKIKLIVIYDPEEQSEITTEIISLFMLARYCVHTPCPTECELSWITWKIRCVRMLSLGCIFVSLKILAQIPYIFFLFNDNNAFCCLLMLLVFLGRKVSPLV